MTTTHEVEDYAFEGDTFNLNANAFFELSGDRYYDADIGGSDGWEWTSAELTHAQLDGLQLRRPALEEALGSAEIKRIEAELLTMLSDGTICAEAA